MSDTIAAISTGMSDAGIGIIRISGDDALTIANSVFQGTDLRKCKPNTVHYGHLVDQGEIVDEVYALVFHGPKSYTMEDVVEFDCHGGMRVLRDALSLIYRAGARPAEAGEFTKRAFLNGRIDLSQSESVMDLIHSKTSFERKVSLSHLNGNLSKKVRDLREKILHEAAFLEAALDDPEHYSLDQYPSELDQKIEGCIQEIDQMIRSYQQGSLLKNGIRTAIVGRPNVGKSSLLNLLSGKDRAIVTDVPGTTRDLLEEEIVLNDIPLLMMDTAGIHETDDLVEKIGVKRSLDALKNADLVFFLIDGSRPLSQEDLSIVSDIPNVPTLVLFTKSDLEQKADPEIIRKALSHRQESRILHVNCKNEETVCILSHEIEKLFLLGNLSNPDQFLISNDRQKYDMEEARKSLKLVQKSIRDGMSEDLFTIDLMDAYRYLGYVIGEEVEDDLVDKVFSDFCMGK
ncbi:tRNA uridine-5-carboxymethylaminomethyl(34) synthesis GTPase MnmE [Lachnospiraceae bacterium YH-ros2228]